MSKQPDRSGSVLDRRSIRFLYGLGGVCAAALLIAWGVTTHANPTVTIPDPVLPKGYVLYSVGRDGRDDGGAPVYDGKAEIGAHPEARYYVKHDSIGDVVAGKNL